MTTTFVYDGSQLLEERRSDGNLKRYVYGPGIDRPLAQVLGATASYFIADHLGSIVRITDSLGTPILARTYDPWGNLLEASTESGYAFAGREWEPDSNQYYYRARHYDPRIGRFLSEDPLGINAGVNLYSYVHNRPVSATDPFGLYIYMKLDEGRPQYNLSSVCFGSSAASCIKWMSDGPVGPCRLKKDGCYGFDVRITVAIHQEFSMSQDEAASWASGGQPWLSVQQHEDLHMADYRTFITEPALNATVRTDGFAKPQECQSARAGCESAISNFLISVKLMSQMLRDPVTR